MLSSATMPFKYSLYMFRVICTIRCCALSSALALAALSISHSFFNTTSCLSRAFLVSLCASLLCIGSSRGSRLLISVPVGAASALRLPCFIAASSLLRAFSTWSLTNSSSRASGTPVLPVTHSASKDNSRENPIETRTVRDGSKSFISKGFPKLKSFCRDMTVASWSAPAVTRDGLADCLTTCLRKMRQMAGMSIVRHSWSVSRLKSPTV
mmetsp:Transcript_30063/g.58885  ORF Transcript_30063/g.58885 Transcript_30063/m.58885 type:complete len:210 (+) Transcript_30063:546-1175(+)